MKLCFVLLAIISTCKANNILTNIEKTRLNAAHGLCIISYDVQEKYIMDLLRGHNVEDPNLRSYVDCMFKALNFKTTDDKYKL